MKEYFQSHVIIRDEKVAFHMKTELFNSPFCIKRFTDENQRIPGPDNPVPASINKVCETLFDLGLALLVFGFGVYGKGFFPLVEVNLAFKQDIFHCQLILLFLTVLLLTPLQYFHLLTNNDLFIIFLSINQYSFFFHFSFTKIKIEIEIEMKNEK